MIAGTPVLDIKPYIPEYDSPHTRIDSEPPDPNSDQPQATTVSPNETTDILNLHKDSDVISERPDDDVSETEIPLADSSVVSAQLSLPKDLHSVLEDVKHYVTQGDLCQLSCESKDQLSDSPKTKLQESTVDHPHYGEEARSTIAGWIREPPVGSLDVRFTPHAERELAEFLPSHLPGKPDLEHFTQGPDFCGIGVAWLSLSSSREKGDVVLFSTRGRCCERDEHENSQS